MAEAQVNRQMCTSETCTEDAKVFCKSCNQFFCENHRTVHSKFLKQMKIVHQVITVREHQEIEREENSRFCTQHQKSVINLACINCYRPLCPDCFDEVDSNTELMRCPFTKAMKHDTRSVKQVATKIQDKLKDILSEFRVNEMKVEDDIWNRRKKYDQQMEVHRADLDKLKSKVDELHKLLDEHYEQLKETIKGHMKQRKELMDVIEAEFDQYRKNCQELHEGVSDLLNKSSEFIVKENLTIKEKMNPLMQFKLEDGEEPPHLYLVIKDDPVTFPISLQTTQPYTPQMPQPPVVKILKSLKLENNLQNSANERTVCAKYLQDGWLILSGHYAITGLGFNLNIVVDKTRVIYSIYQHKSSLYVLQRVNSDKQYHIHCISLDNQSVKVSIIRFSGLDDCFQHLTVSDDFILITHFETDSIKVYSTTTHNHLLDVRDTSKFKCPWGVCLLGDTVVVGDCENSQVVNMTISSTPQVNWVCSEIYGPSSIVTDHSSQTIFVGEFIKKQIHIISFQGEKLSTIVPPSINANISDISVHNNQLVVTTESQILTYEMSYAEN